jgi:hypothetical protein
MATAKVLRIFVHVKEVCELFDVNVLSDMESVSDDENDPRFKSVYAIGWNGEPDAGIRYGTMTGWFDSMELLEDFCKRNIERFRAEAAKDDAAIPDASDWS